MKAVAILSVLFAVALSGAVVVVGSLLSRPVQSVAGLPPPELNAQPVAFSSLSGATLHGWMTRGRPGGGIVVLMHGVRANRRAMLRRALLLRRHGFSVLLFDFQAHGESLGRHITFGHLEGRDATASVEYARQLFPGERIGVLGVSLGGAAALLAPEPLKVDAMVLESVFPDIHSALVNRLRARLGGIAGPILAPLIAPPFEWLMPVVLGVGIKDLRPIGQIGKINAPLLMASGTQDPYTTVSEARALFAHASNERQFWSVDGAGHFDLERYDPTSYWGEVLPFLKKHLQHGEGA
jgi:pimeloyl-ACP methyl ester carboxylesterase